MMDISFIPIWMFKDSCLLVKQPGQLFETVQVSLPGKLRIHTGKHFFPLFSLANIKPSYKN